MDLIWGVKFEAGVGLRLGLGVKFEAGAGIRGLSLSNAYVIIVV